MAKITNEAGDEIDFDVAVQYMDDDVRERVHSDVAPCSEDAFWIAYCAAHRERFSEEFFLNTHNPVW
jgi:hypothetical protein